MRVRKKQGAKPSKLAKGTGKFAKNPKNQGAHMVFYNMTKNQAPLKQFDRPITLRELKKHRRVDDCWLAIDGKVYDVTDYIKYHPGGKKILMGAGKDATKLFSK